MKRIAIIPAFNEEDAIAAVIDERPCSRSRIDTGTSRRRRRFLIVITIPSTSG